MVQTLPYADSTFAVGVVIPKKNPTHGYYIRSLSNGKVIVIIQLNKRDCAVLIVPNPLQTQTKW